MTNQEAAAAVFSHFEDPAGDKGPLLAALDDDIVYEAPYYADFKPRVGKGELAAMLERVEGEGGFFTDQTFPTKSLLATEDPDLFIIEVTGDHGVRSTGKRYRNHYLHFARCLQARSSRVSMPGPSLGIT